MGIRVEPDPRGDDCLTCWDAGKTPQTVYAIFKGIETGDWWTDIFPPPPNHTFKLDQSLFDPCVFNYTGLTWFVEYQARTIFPPRTQSSLKLWFNIGDVFAQLLDGTCKFSFINNLQVPVGNYYYKGSGWVFELTI